MGEERAWVWGQRERQAGRENQRQRQKRERNLSESREKILPEMPQGPWCHRGRGPRSTEDTTPYPRFSAFWFNGISLFSVQVIHSMVTQCHLLCMLCKSFHLNKTHTYIRQNPPLGYLAGFSVLKAWQPQGWQGTKWNSHCAPRVLIWPNQTHEGPDMFPPAWGSCWKQDKKHKPLWTEICLHSYHPYYVRLGRRLFHYYLSTFSNTPCFLPR